MKKIVASYNYFFTLAMISTLGFTDGCGVDERAHKLALSKLDATKQELCAIVAELGKSFFEQSELEKKLSFKKLIIYRSRLPIKRKTAPIWML